MLHKNIIAIYFYVGESSSANNDYIANDSSTWDENWTNDFGGIDTPHERNETYLYYPAKFIPKENPFYVALPYDDFDKNGKKKSSAKKIPWYMPTYQSLMKNRWIMIQKNGKTAYAQIEDVGPFETDDFDYVFCPDKPTNTFGAKAGIDVSPAVKIYLGLKDIDHVNWKFVKSYKVPNGPWKNIITTSGVSWVYKSWPEFNISTTWQIQLQGDLNTSYDVNSYDVDLFDTSKDTIDKLHNAGRKVICYFDAGSYEDWRYDSYLFPKEALGKKMDGWDERWIDIRNPDIKQIMINRLDLAKEKGCDAVDPDNVDGYTNDTGFNLTYDDQLKYNVFLAYETHKRRLSIGLKNDLKQINDLVMYFDFAINEQCHQYNECSYLKPFIEQDKTVFNIEYNTSDINNSDFCDQVKQEKFQTLILPRNLDDSFRYSCE